MFKLKPWWQGRISRGGKIAAISGVCVVLVGLVAGAWAVLGEQKNISVTIDGEAEVYTTYSHTVADFLADQNIRIGEQDAINLALDSELKDGQEIVIDRAAEVAILADGDTYHVSALNMTVGEALEQVGVVLGGEDVVRPELDTPLTKGMVIDVDRIEVKEEVREMELAYAVEKKRDSAMPVTEEKVISPGEPGKQVDTYRVVYSDGKIIKEELIDSQVTEPVNKVVVTGSYDVASRSGNKSASVSAAGKDAAQYAPNGMAYSETLTVKATAYTHDGSKTKMGTQCRVGAIAVDPSVIPLGTELYVEGYGYCTAEDTGGKIKGNRIDIFLDTEAECVDWGVRTVTVYILK